MSSNFFILTNLCKIRAFHTDSHSYGILFIKLVKLNKCGYARCINALEFHHLDPLQKDFNISNIKLTTFDKRTMEELDKCIMVCANCHREIHYQKLAPCDGLEPPT